MGLEAKCRVRQGGRASDGRARLEEKDLWFKGDFRLKIPFSEIEEVEARGADLVVKHLGTEALFELGKPAAEKWFRKIRYPSPLLDKLGVKPESRVSLLGVEGENFRRLLSERTPHIWDGKPGPHSDMVFLQVEEVKGLDKLPQLESTIKRDGAIWVLWPKGQKHIKEGDVRKAALACQLVDVKVVSFSDRLSGLKLVIPVKRR